MPWKLLVPDFVTKFSIPPVVRPYSAAGSACVILNSWTASTEGASSSNEDPFSLRVWLAPSISTSLAKFCPPAIFEIKIPLLLFAVPGPVVPGNKNSKASTARNAPTPPNGSGNWITCLSETTPPTSDDSASTCGAPASTVMLSVCVPT